MHNLSRISSRPRSWGSPRASRASRWVFLATSLRCSCLRHLCAVPVPFGSLKYLVANTSVRSSTQSSGRSLRGPSVAWECAANVPPLSRHPSWLGRPLHAASATAANLACRPVAGAAASWFTSEVLGVGSRVRDVATCPAMILYLRLFWAQPNARRKCMPIVCIRSRLAPTGPRDLVIDSQATMASSSIVRDRAIGPVEKKKKK
ncbi:hypothetical protein GGS23DRAFT_587891, partial [Durotheca rogersii]|uniref:uncharacterized protein n=1 Tax=Durotheca rogersii TaxID=419775 RepID=UPI002220D3FD